MGAWLDGAVYDAYIIGRNAKKTMRKQLAEGWNHTEEDGLRREPQVSEAGDAGLRRISAVGASHDHRLRERPSLEHDKQVIELWLHGRSRHTQRAYRADVVTFLEFAGVGVREVTLGDLQGWTDELQVIAGLAPASVARKLSSV